MAGLFKMFSGAGGGKKGGKAPTPQESIQQMRGVEELLKKKQDFLEQKIEDSTKQIKKHVNTNKRLAKQALLQKKRLEAQLAQIDGQLTNIEIQREAVERAATDQQMLDAMKMGADALKAQHKNMYARWCPSLAALPSSRALPPLPSTLAHLFARGPIPSLLYSLLLLRRKILEHFANFFTNLKKVRKI